MDAYARADWFHQGKAYADEGNLAHFDPYDLVNLRLGVSNDNVLVELLSTTHSMKKRGKLERAGQISPSQESSEV